MTTPSKLRDLVAQPAPQETFTIDDISLTMVNYYGNINWAKLQLPDDSDEAFRTVVDLFKQGECIRIRSNRTLSERPRMKNNRVLDTPIDCGFGTERRLKNKLKAAQGPAVVQQCNRFTLGTENQGSKDAALESSNASILLPMLRM